MKKTIIASLFFLCIGYGIKSQTITNSMACDITITFHCGDGLDYTPCGSCCATSVCVPNGSYTSLWPTSCGTCCSKWEFAEIQISDPSSTSGICAGACGGSFIVYLDPNCGPTQVGPVNVMGCWPCAGSNVAYASWTASTNTLAVWP